MKLSKSVLAGSLATAGIVLGAIAPAITAQAATGTGKIDDKGNVTYQDPTTDVGALGDSDSKMAIAFTGSEAGQDGQASATSNANVTVQSGLLTLDAVPDFGFANAAEGTTVALANNDKNGSTAADSQGKGVLTITESRQNQPGFTVDASISKFANIADKNDTKPYILNLTPTELKNDKGGKITDGTKKMTNEINISGDPSSTVSTTNPAVAASGTLIDLGAGTYNAGSINASFTTADDDAFLNLDNGTPASGAKDSNSSKSYNATITWTLKAKAASDSEVGK